MRKSKKKEAIEGCRRRREEETESMSEMNRGEEEERERGKFFGCYLLISLSPRHKGHSYIGFTVNPKRRLRQHNGEISSGAFRTKKKRPWDMVLCIHGFPSYVSALQFEWAWQHPRESIAVREAAASFKSLGGLANKIKLALTMLTLSSWHCMDLTVSFFSTKYMKHAAGCPTLPPQMKLHFCSMDELPCYCHPDHPYVYDDQDDFHLHHSHGSANFHDHSRECSTHGLAYTNPFSIDTQSCTLDDASENVPLEEDSSSITANATQEEHIRLIHQSPTDVHSSRLDQGDPIDPFAIGIVPDNDSLIIEELLLPPRQLPVDVHSSLCHDFIGDLTFGKEISTKDLRTSFPIMRKHKEPLHLRDPADREQFSVDYCLSGTGTFTQKEFVTCALIDKSTEEYSEPIKVSPVRLADTVKPFYTQEIEVIDLFTPSPDCKIIEVSKKRRDSGDCPSFIDLTRSPCFIEL